MLSEVSRVKYRSVWVAEKSTIRDVINGIKTYLSPSMVWFKDKLEEIWWAYNTLCESHRNKMDLETMQVWDYIIKNDLKELIDITYTNKMHLLFGSPSLKNSKVKCVCLEAIMGWVAFWEVFSENVWVKTKHVKSLMLVCGNNQ